MRLLSAFYQSGQIAQDNTGGCRLLRNRIAGQGNFVIQIPIFLQKFPCDDCAHGMREQIPGNVRITFLQKGIQDLFVFDQEPVTILVGNMAQERRIFPMTAQVACQYGIAVIPEKVGEVIVSFLVLFHPMNELDDRLRIRAVEEPRAQLVRIPGVNRDILVFHILRLLS